MTSTDHTGSGDFARSLELLWGLDRKPSRGPKPGLTLDRIVTTAITIADTEGLEALSMRRAATELGVGTMSLYRYVPGKAELLDLMIDQVNDPCDGEEFDPELGWRSALERIARGTWQMYTRHPWLLWVDQARPVLGPNSLAGLEIALGAIRDITLSDREKMAVLTIIDGGFVNGLARSHFNEKRAAARTGVSDEKFWQAQAPILATAMSSGNYPLLAALAEDAFSTDGEAAFEFGLQRMLDGLEAYVDGRAAHRDRD
ncbi:TetR/AcrR family transcriptional regulator C-terminal domain-containing protein [Streptomyces sp. SID3343]|uniref:TetR/AcrR family transcriptional regulator C-terminal domain-containing protein n=1 Tax=Streptomyces sp. SID3343 TaxID=2690260 RepID=UPI00136CDFD4|nr:TetR/AcrR family transcriptional regulator C-terminal domain-containing protein [Streptomyces sp. SID3343]MYV99872.1 TetR family transcriptional regulator [Streptomyces sp. SID3343]